MSEVMILMSAVLAGELLLVLLAAIILLGRYTGYRISELIRFKNFEEAA